MDVSEDQYHLSTESQAIEECENSMTDILFTDSSPSSSYSDPESVLDFQTQDERATSSESPTLMEELFMFSLLFHVSGRAMDFLLKLLCRHGVADIPSSFYILKKVAEVKKYQCQEMKKGKFSYISIADNLKFCIDEGF